MLPRGKENRKLLSISVSMVSKVRVGAMVTSAEVAGDFMRAFQYDRYGGGSDGLQSVHPLKPSPRKDELLVKIEAASLNPADWKIQKGMLRPFLPRKFPFTPVTDVAGEVSLVGPGVTAFKEGDKVVSKLPLTTAGGLAEYAIARANMTVIRPPQLSAAEGSGLGIAALTALEALKSLGVKLDGTDERKNILITAASGGVGHYAVQLAKLGNFHTTATCGARNMDLVRGLGADEVVDYKTPDGDSLRSPTGRKYDCVINCATGIPWSKIQPNLTATAKVIEIAPTGGNFLTSMWKKITLSKQQLVTLMLVPELENLEFLVDLAKDGKIKTVVDSSFPLSMAKDAWARSMDGHATGKVIIDMTVDHQN